MGSSALRGLLTVLRRDEADALGDRVTWLESEVFAALRRVGCRRGTHLNEWFKQVVRGAVQDVAERRERPWTADFAAPGGTGQPGPNRITSGPWPKTATKAAHQVK